MENIQEKKEEEEEEEARRKTPPSTTTPSPQPSCTSSPSPSSEFSFTISFHPSPNSNSSSIYYNNATPSMPITLPPSFLSSISSSPSDFSIEHLSLSSDTQVTQDKPKSSPLSSFLSFSKWLPKRSHNTGVINKQDSCSCSSNINNNNNNNQKKKKKKKNSNTRKKAFNISRVFKRYKSVMESLFFFKREKAERRGLSRRPYSFSVKDKDGLKSRRRREFSAPVSMRTSPTNSGLLVAAPATFSSPHESSMEELHSAIQAAIAHCKNSCN
ncbi:hypothetical protein IHE45_19G043700 [Dioscorea alata]|uniref:Uncharacterized protein n=1 Tax=Dioscorea alata TaxID=55571 RepID=A0ACB7TY36_DIOAL|nr:hypothetical protein IHE45_19G043700 [Dioscorea alata]